MTSLTSFSQEDLGSAAQKERRRRILEATTGLASQGGFDAVQMRAVAERADVALGTLYRYFPSKIHLLVAALAVQFDRAEAAMARRPASGATEADRVLFVLERATSTLQRDPNLTEALTRAFIFADKSVAGEIEVVGMQLTRMFTRAMKGDAYVEGEPPDAETIAVAQVISDVWLSALVSWVTGRNTSDDVVNRVKTAVRLVLG